MKFNSLHLNPDEAPSTEVANAATSTTPANKPFAIDDKVAWEDDKGTAFEGSIILIENNTAVVQDTVNGGKYRVNLSDLERAEEGEEVLEIIEGIKFVKKSYKKERKPNAKKVNLTGYSFAAPRFNSVEQFIAHVDARLKEQNKHKSQNPDKGVTAEEVVLDNLHSMMDNKLRTRVSNEAQEAFDGKGAEWSKDRANVLFSAKDAYNWVPGVREPGAASLIKTLSMKIKEMQAAGKDMSDPEFMKVLMELATVAAPK